jgi:osmotically-inducible protein OsmY
VDLSEVRIEVLAGVVRLSGIVDRWSSRLAVARVARRVPGVRDVASEIQVRSDAYAGYTDTDLADAVRAVLERDPAGARIASMVASGHVTLEGPVESAAQRAAIERAVRALSGLRGLSNAITVVAPSTAYGFRTLRRVRRPARPLLYVRGQATARAAHVMSAP